MDELQLNSNPCLHINISALYVVCIIFSKLLVCTLFFFLCLDEMHVGTPKIRVGLKLWGVFGGLWSIQVSSKSCHMTKQQPFGVEDLAGMFIRECSFVGGSVCVHT